MWGRYWCMWGWGELKWVDRRGAVLLVANEIIGTVKQLPKVSREVVWGRAALCLAGASCDWWGGNIEKYEHGA